MICFERLIHSPNDDDEKIEKVPYWTYIRPLVEGEPVGYNLHKTFYRKYYHKDNLDLFLRKKGSHYSHKKDTLYIRIWWRKMKGGFMRYYWSWCAPARKAHETRVLKDVLTTDCATRGGPAPGTHFSRRFLPTAGWRTGWHAHSTHVSEPTNLPLLTILSVDFQICPG